MDLGQVFTKSKIADYMVSLFSIEKEASVLDPCFGAGAFLAALKKTGNYKVFGYEIDKDLYKKVSSIYPDYTLKNKDFLQIPSKKKFDGIIMNPPYIRHEKINDMKTLGVDKDVLSNDSLYKELPSTANLYMYFIIKAISLLKKNGEMVVIFPGSWLQARNGNRFEAALYNRCSVERQIHISGDVFEESALVDVLILKLKKDNMNRQASPEFIKSDDDGLNIYDSEQASINLEFMTPFSSIGKVRRGLTTGCNDMFINPDIATNTVPIISSPKQICGFSTKGAETDNLLFVKPEDIDDVSVSDYLDDWKERITKDNKPKTLVKKIEEKKDWYRLNTFDCRGILFSYFVRNDMKFVYNETDNVIRDNFYILYPSIDTWICFALLNNHYTYYQLETIGKKYGAGLLKIQRYDIENLTFPDIKKITSNDKSELKKLGKKLAKTGDKNIIKSITSILSNYSEVSYDTIISNYNNIVKSRLENI